MIRVDLRWLIPKCTLSSAEPNHLNEAWDVASEFDVDEDANKSKCTACWLKLKDPRTTAKNAFNTIWNGSSTPVTKTSAPKGSYPIFSVQAHRPTVQEVDEIVGMTHGRCWAAHIIGKQQQRMLCACITHLVMSLFTNYDYYADPRTWLVCIFRGSPLVSFAPFNHEVSMPK